MTNELTFPTPEEMKEQYPIFESLVRKDFKKSFYGNFPVQVIRIGIVLFFSTTAFTGVITPRTVFL